MEKVYIKWIDAMADNSGWKTIEDAVEWAETVQIEIDEVGYILEENDEYILLISKINKDIVSGLTRIPKKYIAERKELIIKKS